MVGVLVDGVACVRGGMGTQTHSCTLRLDKDRENSEPQSSRRDLSVPLRIGNTSFSSIEQVSDFFWQLYGDITDI